MKQRKEAEKAKKEAEDAERLSAVEEARRAEQERRTVAEAVVMNSKKRYVTGAALRGRCSVVW